MTFPLPSSLLAASIALPVLPAAAGGPFAWSLVLSGAVVVLSLIPLGAARSQADFKPSDLAAPRAMFERLPAWGKRANWAHQNSFEAFTLHAPACLLCLVVAPGVLAASPGWRWRRCCTQPCAWATWRPMWPTSPVRSLCWAGGILCTALLYSEGLRAVLRS